MFVLKKIFCFLVSIALRDDVTWACLINIQTGLKIKQIDETTENRKKVLVDECADELLATNIDQLISSGNRNQIKSTTLSLFCMDYINISCTVLFFLNESCEIHENQSSKLASQQTQYIEIF